MLRNVTFVVRLQLFDGGRLTLLARGCSPRLNQQMNTAGATSAQRGMTVATLLAV